MRVLTKAILKKQLLSVLYRGLSLSILLIALFSLAFERAQACTPAQSKQLQIAGIEFAYKTDDEVRFLERKKQWQSKTRGELTLEALEILALEAYEEAGVEEAFETWRFQGGPHPRVFRPRIQVKNTGSTALLDIKGQVSWWGKIGELRVDPDLMMTDYGHLSATADWESLYEGAINVPVLAPGETVSLSEETFQLYRFLRAHPNRWPAVLEFRVDLCGGKLKGKATLPMIPDHFVVPTFY